MEPFLPDQLATFVYWIKERHAVHLKRTAGKPKPWSDDPVMQSVFFTNPYRENDKVTIWFREHIREPLRNKPEVFFATVAFRRFNSIPTGEVILKHKLHLKWDAALAAKVIKEAIVDKGQPYLSGAYIITGRPGENKLQYLSKINQEIYDNRKQHVKALEQFSTLREGHKYLLGFPNVGTFIAYEWITDLRHTYLFDKAEDINTWFAFGPGAERGMSRLLYAKPDKALPGNRLALARKLLTHVQKKLPKLPTLEMREIEHSLCEFDKYMRVKNGGKPKRWYNAS